MARRRTGPTNTVRDLIHERDGGRCVRCGSTHRLTFHHRVNRGKGGAREPWINQAHNLLPACRLCNAWFEDNPKTAMEAGWKVRRPQVPDEIEVCYADGHVYRLTSDGVRTVVVGAAQ
ncbi:HNH endonuclease [Streptomyces sp. NPDC057539]|uniref:HNH endonuclease n=1 Tax=Streptomyces sp. NPDC057539 TaxID=3346159 RepID=UPI0036C9D5D3